MDVNIKRSDVTSSNDEGSLLYYKVLSAWIPIRFVPSYAAVVRTDYGLPTRGPLPLDPLPESSGILANLHGWRWTIGLKSLEQSIIRPKRYQNEGGD